MRFRKEDPTFLFGCKEPKGMRAYHLVKLISPSKPVHRLISFFPWFSNNLIIPLQIPELSTLISTFVRSYSGLLVALLIPRMWLAFFISARGLLP